MFSGIVEKTAPVTALNLTKEGGTFSIPTGFKDLNPGESISVSGVCLTVVESTDSGDALFYISKETLSKTTFLELKINHLVNLERALMPRSRLSGHFVQGHVDGIGICEKVTPQGESFELQISLPDQLLPYCVSKGSIAINGVSLTLNQILMNTCFVNLIPFTWKHTQFSQLREGDGVHIEVDLLAKYVENLCKPYLKQ